MWRVNACVLVAVLSQCSADNLIVALPNGKVQGASYTSANGLNFYAWRHIPYAKPPLGELRFLPPVAPDAWTGVLDGTKDSQACFFVGFFAGDPEPSYGYSEDCLYINVYSSSPEAGVDIRPVMFWIYGGGFYAGAADFSFYDPTPLLEDDVIVVTFNYRLNIFGFLSTEDKIVPGNAALKDQLQALKWTRENIAFFGGNPLDITIFGESAGATSVGYHLVSDRSRNLFTGAIMESGSALLDVFQADGRNNALSIATQIDPSITSASTSGEILKVLQQVDAGLLVDISKTAQSNYHTLFKPILEYEHADCFLCKPMYEELAAGNFTQVPTIIGTNSEEQLRVYSTLADLEKAAETYDSNHTLLLPNINFKNNVAAGDAALQIKEQYAGDGSFEEDVGALVRFLSDNKFVRGIIKQAVLQSQFSPVYFYQFSFWGTASKDNLEIPGCGRVAHADELSYLFNISTKTIETEDDFLARRRLVKLWTNFAKTKNPTPNDDTAELLQDAVWDQLDAEHLQYLDIGEDLVMKSNRKAEETAFWDYIWNTYTDHPYNHF